VRIAFLNPTGELGGAETGLLEVLVGLREARPSWSLHLVVASNGPLVGRARACGVSTTVLPFPASLARLGEWGRRNGVVDRAALMVLACRAAVPTLAYILRLRRLLLDLDPDVVHTNGVKMHVLGVWARPPRAAVLWHVHDYLGARPLTSRVLRRHVARCAGIIANSHSVAGELRALFGDAVPVHPVYNAVDLDRFAPTGPVADLDALAGLPRAHDVVKVGLLATFARWKGHETFLNAIARLPSTLRVRGYIIGGPLYHTDRSQYSMDELRARARELGISSQVGFTGYVSDPASAIRALDIVVHASTEPEPFGLVIAEAMACGRPVIISGAGGAAEIADEGVNALSHPPGDADALAARIAQAAGDPALRRRLGEAGRAAAVERFTRARLTGALAPVYEALVSRPPSQLVGSASGIRSC
jgi:glycosyltransferase involved in cell wall biosynthesis